MIEPNMATMLAFITTDAAMACEPCGRCLQEAVSGSFNRISVDGDQSCNDTVLMLANGASGCTIGPENDAGWALMREAVNRLCLILAKMIVTDGEGATKFVTLHVTGAACEADARSAARAVANSLLVKTSWFGEDPNWGRVIDAAGYSGAALNPEKVRVCYDDLTAYDGASGPHVDAVSALETVLKQDAFAVTVDLGVGDASWELFTCDCSHDYVTINSEYTT